MAAARSAKAGQDRHGRGGSGRKSGGSFRAPRGAGLNQPPPDLLSEVSERQLFARFSDLTLVAFLAVAAALPYLNTLRNGFVSDDEIQVLHNPYIRNLQHLGGIFTTQVAGYAGVDMPNYYRPFMNLEYLICYRVLGHGPFGFHLINLVLHVVVVGVVFLFSKRMFQDRNLALMTAGLFAIHPIHSEAVAWIAASPDLELSSCYMLTFWFFLDAARPGGRLSYWAQAGMAGSFVLALLSKEQAVTLPLLATIYEHFYRADRAETTPAQKASRYAVLWLLAAAYFLFRIRVLGAASSGFHMNQLTWYETLVSAFALLGQYLWKAVWPVNLQVFCPFHKSASLFEPTVLGGLVAVAICCGLFFYLWRHARTQTFGLLWMLLLLGPVLNARWMPPFVFADRYFYLPSVGFCWMLAWGFLTLWSRYAGRGIVWSRALASGFVILVLLCSARIIARNRDWRSSLVLYSEILGACPDATYIRRDLGATYWQMGDVKSAEREWREVLEVDPDNVLALEDLGLMYLKEQRYPEAIEYYKKALMFDPNNGEAHEYLGVTYMDSHSPELAESELRKAVSITPWDSNVRNALGKLYLEEGRAGEAEDQFRRSVDIEPNLMGYSNLGLIHWQRGEVGPAEQEWREALRLAPNNSVLLSDLGLVSSNRGRYTEAAAYFLQAIRLKPDAPSPHFNLAIAYGKLGQNESAEKEFRTALSLSPQLLEARARLGMLYLNEGRLKEAEEQFRLSLNARPNSSAYLGLGEVCLRRGDRRAAERAFQSAASLNPTNSQARFKLGALYLSQGRRVEALREYRAGLKSDPGNGDALAAAQKLSAQVREK